MTLAQYALHQWIRLAGAPRYIAFACVFLVIGAASIAADALDPGSHPLVSAGEYTRIYDPSVGEKGPWYINDHCFIRGANGIWHIFGITRAEPAEPDNEDNFAHAIALSLTQKTWNKKPFALSVDWDTWKETHLWAPHVVFHNGTYYMFYCGGGVDDANYRIQLATSTDLWRWKRHPKNPVFTDGFHARDPMVLRVGDQWVMYYTANSDPTGGYHIVAYRTSKDLVTWSERKTAFTFPQKGTWGGPTESPFVVRRGVYYYLFCGPMRVGGGGRGTAVYRSRDPFHWDKRDEVAVLDPHAPEVIRDTDGKWYISDCGWGRGGVYLAPLYWNDGLDDSDTSLPTPGGPAAKR